jgi:hypothetical protein
MKILNKPDRFAPAFEIVHCASDAGSPCKSCGQPVASNRTHLAIRKGVKLPDGPPLSGSVELPSELTPGKSYSILASTAGLYVAPLSDESIGGFHVGHDGAIISNSIWDSNWRPKCPNPSGMVLVNGLFWVDIYLLNDDPESNGTSCCGVTIADGSNPPTKMNGIRTCGLNWWGASEVLALHGKQLLSVPEFTLAARGVEEGKNFGSDPKTTGHVPGLRSEWGLEQATGCMWTWSRDQQENGWCRVLGGDWNASDAGPRRLSNYSAINSSDYIGARGRCDHLILG